jgi:hypothetical protein
VQLRCFWGPVGHGKFLSKRRISSLLVWKECNSVGNRGGTQEPQWPRAERARLRAPEHGHRHISDFCFLPKIKFLPTQVAVAQLFQPVPFGHPRFVRSLKIVWRGAAPCALRCPLTPMANGQQCHNSAQQQLLCLQFSVRTMGWYKEACLRRRPAGSHEPAPCLSPPDIRNSPLALGSHPALRRCG